MTPSSGLESHGVVAQSLCYSMQREGRNAVNLRRGLAAGAVIFSAVAIGIALDSGEPAHAVGPPADGTYTFNEAGVSGAI
jgi:hypothetical protein